jgi:hypothetical protein
LDKVTPPPSRFKHVERADHIYHGAAKGVGGTTRDLEAGQVQYMRDSTLDDRSFDIGE